VDCQKLFTIGPLASLLVSKAESCRLFPSEQGDWAMFVFGIKNAKTKTTAATVQHDIAA
jgi:hypothetical protein